jgi:hypothetical protein
MIENELGSKTKIREKNEAKSDCVAFEAKNIGTRGGVKKEMNLRDGLGIELTKFDNV